MDNQKYWHNRSIQKITDYEKKLKRLENNMQVQFDNVYKDIETQISKLYFKYADENGLSYSDAVKYLNSIERKELQGTLKEYIEKAKSYDKKYQRELKEMSIRARITRLERLKANINHSVNSLYYTYVKPNTQITLEHILHDDYYKTIFDIQQFTGYGVAFDLISKNTLETLLEYPWSGSNYSQKIWGHVSNFSTKLENILTSGIIQGKSNQKMAEELKKATDTAYKNTVRLVRTETNFISNQATVKAYESYNVDEYQYLATLDYKTSKYCRELDMKVFNTKDSIVGVNYPPLHPYCRSTTIPYFPDLDEDGGTRVARDRLGKTYKVPGDMNYKEWYAEHVELRETEQLAVNKYLSSQSYKINEKLRNNIKLDDDDKKLVKHLDNALRKLPKYNGTVTRSLYFYNNDDLKQFLKTHNKGDIIKYTSYVSTTIGDTYNPFGQVELIIKSKNGRDLTTYNQQEQEILFRRNTKFKVIDVIEKENKKIIYLWEE